VSSSPVPRAESGFVSLAGDALLLAGLFEPRRTSWSDDRSCGVPFGCMYHRACRM